jgi:GMP synthase-like glutamine amidotransferase
MFHWHTEAFELPRLPGPATPPPPGTPPAPSGNSLLSSTKTTKNQAFRFKNRLFGFQYHMELTPGDIDAILSAGRDELQKAQGPDAEKNLRQETEKHWPRYRRLGDHILRNFVQFTKTY